MLLHLVWVLGVTLVISKSAEEECTLERDIAELVEMIPFEKVMSLAMEYAISDQQVKSVLGYLSGPKFRGNMAALEASPQFSQLAGVAEIYQIDAYSLANKFNSALDMPPVKYAVEYRRKRSPGDGVVSFLKEAFQMMPLADIREAYNHKMDCNPQFKSLMERLLSGEGRAYFDPVLASPPLLETRKDVEELGIPTDQILKFVLSKTNEFFDRPTVTPTKK